MSNMMMRRVKEKASEVARSVANDGSLISDLASQLQLQNPLGSQRPATFADFSAGHHQLITDVIDRTSDDEVKLKLSNLLKLIQASAGEANEPPVNYFIGSVSFQGEARPDAASLRARIEVSLLREKWTAVPLFPDSVALVGSQVSFRSATHAVETSKENPFSLVFVDPRISSEQQKDAADSPKGAAYCIGVVQKSYVLVASLPGNYVVDMEILVPYATSRKTGFVLAIPKAAQGDVTFKVHEKDVLIKVDPSLFSTNSTGGDGESKNVSAVTCRCPPTNSLSVQWTENMGTSEVKAPQKVEVSSTVEQKNLISVGEGIVIVRSMLSYTITSGQMSLFEIEIDNRLKVISVEGLKHIPVKRWEVDQKDERGRRPTRAKDGKRETPKADAEAAAGLEGSAAERAAAGREDHGTSILKVWLDYGLEDSYDFTVTAEMDMHGTSGTVEIPSLSCLVNREVVRDKGYLAVEARTNVEVEESAVSGLAMLDISEIPDALFGMAANPLLLGYKFLVPQYRLWLAVKKHADVGVLIAVVDSARVTATYTDAGAVLYRLHLQVRNTQKQYVRIAVPDKEFDIWSTMVADRAVKPAMDSDGRVMIPLQKASKADAANNDTSFLVEFVYYVKRPELRNYGSLSLQLPFCDIPVNYLSVSLYLPENFRYGEFEGMREVVNFSRAAPAGGANAGYRRPMPQPQMVQQQAQMPQMPQMPSSNVGLDDQLAATMDFDGVSQKQRFRSAAGGMMAKGTTGWLPVKVEIPEAGRQFRFEQLLVSEEKHSTLSTTFAEQQKGWFAKRRTGYCEIL